MVDIEQIENDLLILQSDNTMTKKLLGEYQKYNNVEYDLLGNINILNGFKIDDLNTLIEICFQKNISTQLRIRQLTELTFLNEELITILQDMKKTDIDLEMAIKKYTIIRPILLNTYYSKASQIDIYDTETKKLIKDLLYKILNNYIHEYNVKEIRLINNLLLHIQNYQNKIQLLATVYHKDGDVRNKKSILNAIDTVSRYAIQAKNIRLEKRLKIAEERIFGIFSDKHLHYDINGLTNKNTRGDLNNNDGINKKNIQNEFNRGFEHLINNYFENTIHQKIKDEIVKSFYNDFSQSKQSKNTNRFKMADVNYLFSQ